MSSDDKLSPDKLDPDDLAQLDDAQTDALLDRLAKRDEERDEPVFSDIERKAMQTATRRGLLGVIAGGIGGAAMSGNAAASGESWGSASGTVGTDANPLAGLNVSDGDLQSLQVVDTAQSPTEAGEFRQNAGDVEVQTGGSVKNLSDIGSGSGTDYRQLLQQGYCVNSLGNTFPPSQTAAQDAVDDLIANTGGGDWAAIGKVWLGRTRENANITNNRYDGISVATDGLLSMHIQGMGHPTWVYGETGDGIRIDNSANNFYGGWRLQVTDLKVGTDSSGSHGVHTTDVSETVWDRVWVQNTSAADTGGFHFNGGFNNIVRPLYSEGITSEAFLVERTGSIDCEALQVFGGRFNIDADVSPVRIQNGPVEGARFIGVDFDSNVSPTSPWLSTDGSSISVSGAGVKRGPFSTRNIGGSTDATFTGWNAPSDVPEFSGSDPASVDGQMWYRSDL